LYHRHYLRSGGKTKGLLELFGEWILSDVERQNIFEQFHLMREMAALWDLGEFLGFFTTYAVTLVVFPSCN